MNATEFRTGVIRPVEVYKEAWALMKDQYWMVLAVTFVGIIIGSAVPIVLIGPMVCGIYMCLFEKVEGRPVTFDRLFKGFDFFLPSLIVSVVVLGPVLVLIFVMYLPMIAIAMAGPRMSEAELIPFLVGTIVFELIVVFLMVCLHTLLMFAFPLIADRKLSGLQSMVVSAKAVWQNLGGVAGLFGVGFVLCIVGYLMLCIGIYLVLPIIFMANAVAYRKIFPRLDPGLLDPPPPSEYRIAA
jgi:uncharacterized membrane protein